MVDRNRALDHSLLFERQDMVRSILDSIQDGVFTVDADWRITSFNRAAEEITGWNRMDIIGRYCAEVMGADACGKRCAMRETLESGRPVRDRQMVLSNRHHDRIPISVSTAVLRDPKARFLGGVEIFRDLRDLLNTQNREDVENGFHGIISKSPAVQRIFGILPDVAASDVPVLIQGESGTGKELFANVIHRLSSRKGSPLVKVNCGALPETLLESELFGYVKGAFTDARKDKPGRFQMAHGGTLFLDEIGELPLPTQVKLLRVLQNGEFEALGSTRTVRADVRVLAATNRSLEALMRDELFREDLYYRINVVSLEIPPLRERREDIPLLLHHLIERLNQRTGKEVEGLTDKTFHAILQHVFPGNVRELENILEHAFILCRDSRLVSLQHLPPYLAERRQTKRRPSDKSLLEETERNAILEALKKHKWNRGQAAEELGIGRSTLWRKLKSYGLQA